MKAVFLALLTLSVPFFASAAGSQTLCGAQLHYGCNDDGCAYVLSGGDVAGKDLNVTPANDEAATQLHVSLDEQYKGSHFVCVSGSIDQSTGWLSATGAFLEQSH